MHTPRPIAVALLHEESEGLGLLEPALTRAGFSLVHRLREVQPEDAAAALVISMGGPMGVYEANRHPFLVDELRVLRERLDAERPTLGICLGAQLLAAAAGARVYPGTQGLELGVLPVELTPAGCADPILAALGTPFPVAHWHQDTFDEVPGGVWLARTARYGQQAFRIAGSYGLQFHPELDPPTLMRWLQAAPREAQRSGRSVEEILANDLPALAQALPSLTRLLVRLAAHFAALVQAGGPPR